MPNVTVNGTGLFEYYWKHNHTSSSRSGHGDWDRTAGLEVTFNIKSSFNVAWTAICPARPGCSCYRDDAGGPVQSSLRFSVKGRNHMKAICPARSGCSCYRSDAGGQILFSHSRTMGRNKLWAICPARPGCSCYRDDAGGPLHFPQVSEPRLKEIKQVRPPEGNRNPVSYSLHIPGYICHLPVNKDSHSHQLRSVVHSYCLDTKRNWEKR